MDNLNVLIVDDHMIMRTLLRKYLTDSGIRNVAEAANGSEALKKMDDSASSGSPFNLIMADWSMPVMDGLSLLKKIRERGESNVAFVMITAESEKARIMEALQAGATSYLVKPFTQENLKEQAEKIQQWLKTRG